jgi:hypothetical protein
MNSTAASNFTKLVETCTGFLTAAQIRMFLKRCDDLHLPANPLDDIIHKLGGPNKVAEMTGRKMRYVKQRAGNWEYVRRCKDATSDELTLNIEERKNFQDGRKLVAIIFSFFSQFMEIFVAEDKFKGKYEGSSKLAVA